MSWSVVVLKYETKVKQKQQSKRQNLTCACNQAPCGTEVGDHLKFSGLGFCSSALALAHRPH